MSMVTPVDEYGLTALVPFWSRVQDAGSVAPVLGDIAAAALAPQVGRLFGRTRVADATRVGCCLRNLRTDQWLAELAGNGDIDVVVDLGVGLDTRLMRRPKLVPVYIEVDSAPVINLRNSLIPGTRAIRISADAMDAAAWLHAVPQARFQRTAIVLEGVLAYQGPAAVKNFFRELACRAPGAYVLFDSMTPLTSWISNQTISADNRRPPYKWSAWRTRSLVRKPQRWNIIEESRFSESVDSPANSLAFSQRIIYSLPLMRHSYRFTLAQMSAS